jgi:hypothetical protein
MIVVLQLAVTRLSAAYTRPQWPGNPLDGPRHRREEFVADIIVASPCLRGRERHQVGIHSGLAGAPG